MNGIVAYASYIPYYRLDRKAIGESLGASAGSGTRSVACYDEDTTSMAVEAARAALRGASGVAPAAVYFATANPAYLDKTNATAIHAALDLEPGAAAFDMLGSVRSGMGALRAALDAGRPTLAVLSDVRTGLPGGGDERDGGDAAAAFLCGPDEAGAPALATPIAWASATAEFLERWRVPGDRASRQWEERFGEHVYVPLAEAALTERAEAGRRHGGRDRPPRRRRSPTGARSSAPRPRQARARAASAMTSPRRSAIPGPRTPGSSSPTRSTAPRPISSSRWSRSPTGRTR